MGDFFKTIGKWPVFLAGSFLNNFLSTYSWLRPIWRNPVTAALLIVVLTGGAVGLVATLRAMLRLG
ncbi:DUF751 domain-containing protein [Anthocerotibacter panamensis]|uniref:DUF751 domain-containing protein n=1 Tax=Anthocerotibacter panamensis TaxID=2857077 RepID=UPI001C402F7D|nr:DUF751 domain-containing protein [Anthocerotibacter panamensis]